MDVARRPAQGATVAIPSEASNNGRALLLLQKAGLLKLRRPDDPLSTVRDIVANPKDLKIREIEARILDQVDLALINTNYALDARLDPQRDALLIEGKDSPYVNYVVGRPGADTDPRIRKLVAALRSDAVRRFILERYKGAVIPAF
jgi:D-methionine transport system substrate-binding protein